MKYLIIILMILNIGCSEEFKQTEEGKANLAFVSCMNEKKTVHKCKKIKDFDNHLKCMSSICGRPDAEWTSVTFLKLEKNK